MAEAVKTIYDKAMEVALTSLGDRLDVLGRDELEAAAFSRAARIATMLSPGGLALNCLRYADAGEMRYVRPLRLEESDGYDVLVYAGVATPFSETPAGVVPADCPIAATGSGDAAPKEDADPQDAPDPAMDADAGQEDSASGIEADVEPGEPADTVDTGESGDTGEPEDTGEAAGDGEEAEETSSPEVDPEDDDEAVREPGAEPERDLEGAPEGGREGDGGAAGRGDGPHVPSVATELRADDEMRAVLPGAGTLLGDSVRRALPALFGRPALIRIGTDEMFGFPEDFLADHAGRVVFCEPA